MNLKIDNILISSNPTYISHTNTHTLHFSSIEIINAIQRAQIYNNSPSTLHTPK